MFLDTESLGLDYRRPHPIREHSQDADRTSTFAVTRNFPRQATLPDRRDLHGPNIVEARPHVMSGKDMTARQAEAVGSCLFRGPSLESPLDRFGALPISRRGLGLHHRQRFVQACAEVSTLRGARRC